MRGWVNAFFIAGVIVTGYFLFSAYMFACYYVPNRFVGPSLFVWLFTPVVAVRMNEWDVLMKLSRRMVRILGVVLVVVAVSLSLGVAARKDHFRDWIGKRFVDGYRVSYSEGWTADGDPTTEVEYYARHWYARLGLLVMEWGVVALCWGVPLVTSAASRLAHQKHEAECLE